MATELRTRVRVTHVNPVPLRSAAASVADGSAADELLFDDALSEDNLVCVRVLLSLPPSVSHICCCCCIGCCSARFAVWMI